MSILSLPDGRSFEYEEHGAPGGYTVLFHHGMPGSVVFMPTVLGPLVEAGFHVVTYSRPGYGRSSLDEGRSVLDTARDCIELLAHLGVDHCLTVGWSAGGPHALALAALDPGRVAGVLLIASFAPFEAPLPEFTEGMGAQNVLQFQSAMHGRTVMRETIRQMVAAIRDQSSADVAGEMSSLLPAADVAEMAGPYGADNEANMGYGLSRGEEGWVSDLAALTSGWGFEIASVSTAVDVWHGEEDLMVPVAHGRWLSEQLTSARLCSLPGHGHVSVAVGGLDAKVDSLLKRLSDDPSRS